MKTNSSGKKQVKDIRTADFAGWATVYGVKCEDGRTIKHNAFAEQDKQILPLVWRHLHNDPTSTLGHVLVHHKPEGLFAYGWFNNTPNGLAVKEQLVHGDLDSMSIYANELIERNHLVHSGVAREVSLVYSGSNPGAKITDVFIQHDGGDEEQLDGEVIITFGKPLELRHEGGDDDTDDDRTVGEVFKAALAKLSKDEQDVIYSVIGAAAEGAGEVGHSNDTEGDTFMKKNVFSNTQSAKDDKTSVLMDAEAFREMFHDAMNSGGKLSDAVIAHAGADYGITNPEVLFPDARSMTKEPEWIRRDIGWVPEFLTKANHQPFSRIKSLTADITAEVARARGYITATDKVEGFFAVAKRETTPQTVYIKDKLDRDDIIDITDFSVVAWLKTKMRFMLDEELARAGLIGDGRLITDPFKINETKIRPIYKDDALYNHRVQVASNATMLNVIDAITASRKHYKGTGNPTFFTTADWATNMLLVRDSTGRRIYPTMAELASALRVSSIVEVEVMEGVSRVDGSDTLNLVGIIVNPNDYVYGADRGGEVNFFDDFDIDFNQEKYLIETRCSGCLVKAKSAVTIEQLAAAG